MRVALVLAGPFPAPRGSQVLVRQLAQGLRERAHAVHLVSYGARASARPGPRAGRLVRDVHLVGRLWRVVRSLQIDVIHAHNYEAAIAGLCVARASGTPLVYHGHNALGEELPTYFTGAVARGLAGAFGRVLDRQVPRRADFCIAVSEDLGDMLRRRGVPADGLACIPPAVSPHELGRAAPPPSAGGLVCYAGNLDGYQNLDFLLRSFGRVRARVPGARLVVVTHVGARVSTPLASAAGVEMVRARAYAQVQELLATADVAVCPRVERSGFPMKLLSYMAAGKAIVASAGSGKGLVDGVTARIVPDGDEAAFAGAIATLLEDASMRTRLGVAARAAAESPEAWERALDRVEAIYRRVTARLQPASLAVGWVGRIR